MNLTEMRTEHRTENQKIYLLKRILYHESTANEIMLFYF